MAKDHVLGLELPRVLRRSKCRYPFVARREPKHPPILQALAWSRTNRIPLVRHVEVKDIRVKRKNHNMDYPWFAGLSKPVPRPQQFLVDEIWKLPLREIC